MIIKDRSPTNVPLENFLEQTKEAFQSTKIPTFS